MKLTRLLFVVLLAISLGGCDTAKRQETVESLVKEAKEKFAPDRRTTVFDVHAEVKGRFVTLRGEVQDAQLKQLLIRHIRDTGDFEVVDSLRTLPDSSLGDQTIAIVSVSVANLRTKPNHAAELCTQALLGTPLEVLKKEKGWFYARTPDDYLGWTDDVIVPMAPEEYRTWSHRPRVIVTAEYDVVRQSTGEQGQPVSDVVAGGILGVKRDFGTHFEVLYPDGRSGFLAKRSAERLDRWIARTKDTPESIVETAKRFMGVPYLWGGTSAKGMDCSGFTKMVYFLNGVLLPRDASQQERVGEVVESDDRMSEVRAGDLLFFGSRATPTRKERVTHVAISLGGMRFIHASGDVHINSLDSSDSDYSKPRERTFLRVKRIIGAGESSGIRRVAQIPDYRGNGF